MPIRAAFSFGSRTYRIPDLFELVVLFVLFASTAGVALASEIDPVATADFRSKVLGSGRVVEELRGMLGVSSISLESEGRVLISQGDRESLVIRAEDNLIPHITTWVEGRVLRIGADVELEPTKPIEYLVTVRTLESAELRGAGEIIGSELEVRRLALRLLGAGALRFRNLDATSLGVEILGTGDAHVSGAVDTQTVTISGVGSHLARELASDRAEVEIRGMGEATVWVRDRLRVAIPGTGTVRYIGNPTVDSTITGHGEVAQLAGAPDWRPRELGDGWAVSSPEEQGLDSAVIERMMETAASDPRLDTIYSLLLIRHGTLVAEGYFNGRRPEQTNEIRSATKSFTSLLVGIAMDRRLIESVDQPLLELLPNYADLLGSPEKRRLTLGDALTMRLGLRWEENSPGYYWSEWPRDLVGFTLQQPVQEPAGTRFRYSSGTTQVLAEAVTGATGRELHAFADEALFSPLGIEGTSWMRHDDGSHYGGVGLFIRPRDMAKIGQLALQGGRWETSSGEIRQVVSEAWIRDSTRDHVQRGGGLLEGYGYQWWVDPDDGIFAAIGHGGQWITVLPNQDGVLVTSADPTVGPEDSIDITPLLELAQGLEMGETPGRVGFANERYRVAAGAGRIDLPVRRSAGAGGAAKVAFEVAGGSARAGEDFETVSGVLSWAHGESGPRHVEIPILDDGAREGEETFEVRLSVLTGGVALGRTTATVAIVDEAQHPVGGPGRLHFERGADSGREGEVAEVRVHRLDGGEGEVTVRWTTADRSARGGSDYESAGGLLTWPAGDSSTRSIEVRLHADGLAERTELLDVRLYEPTGGVTLADGDEATVVVAVLDADTEPGCTPDPETLCLNEQRFRVEVEWHDPQTGNGGFGSTLPGTNDTGMLWFFDPANVELVVKVLDGRPLNDAFWIYYGGLSDVEYWLVATDTLSGAVRIYHNPPGNLCGDADTQAFPESLDGWHSPTANPYLAWSSAALSPEAAEASASCTSSDEALCLLDGRFQVEVRWHDPRSGSSGVGRVLDGGAKTGTFWFFDPANVELVVKALDGRPVNGKIWFFYGALSDVEYWITVTDTTTGAERQYHNEPGNLCGRADTASFD